MIVRDVDECAPRPIIGSSEHCVGSKPMASEEALDDSKDPDH